MKNAVLELAIELVKRPSITPDDQGCQQIIASQLAKLGFVIEHLRFGDVDNLWAVLGDKKPLFVFAGHTDVVPTGSLEHWRTDPFQPTVIDGELYGRGAADMKTSLAAMVVAVEEFVSGDLPQRGSIGFLITSDEEGVAVNGTAKVIEHLQQQGTHIDWCLVGEPSSDSHLGDVIRVGRRGSLNGRIHLKGLLGHVAYPDKTPNPVHEVMQALVQLTSQIWDNGNEFFAPTTFQISNFNAGTGAENVIPGEVDILFNFRFNTEQTPSNLKSSVMSALASIDQNIDSKIDWHLSGMPFLSRQDELTAAVATSVFETTGYRPLRNTAGGTSDARFIVPAGTEAVELGPINATIHQINERVAVDDMEPLAKIYLATLNKLLR